MMMSQFIMDLKKVEQRISPPLPTNYGSYASYVHHRQQQQPSQTHKLQLQGGDVNLVGVLDLSRRRDSVETRKTPSPYNTSSSYDEGSPSTQRGSPSTSVVSTTVNGILHVRPHSNSPTLHLDRSPLSILDTSTLLHGQTHQPIHPAANAFSGYYGMGIKREETPSPHQNTACHYATPVASARSGVNFQVKAAQEAALTKAATGASNESDDGGSDTSSVIVGLGSHQSQHLTPSMALYPKIMGRDGKLARPFKAYPRDPLTIAASFSATDALLDTHSAEKYNSFRKRMLEQIHSANGGHATVTNPKMRRTSRRGSSESRPSAVESPPATNCNSSLNRGDERCAISSETTKTLFGENNVNQNFQIASNNNKSHANPTESTSNQNANSIAAAFVDTSSGSNSSINANVIKDSAYYERRRKNNAAAKKSRDRRRIKEDEIAIRAAFLERENIELKFELAAARKQLALFNSANNAPSVSVGGANVTLPNSA